MQCYIGIFFVDSKDIDMADQLLEAEMEVLVDSAEDKVEEGGQEDVLEIEADSEMHDESSVHDSILDYSESEDKPAEASSPATQEPRRKR